MFLCAVIWEAFMLKWKSKKNFFNMHIQRSLNELKGRFNDKYRFWKVMSANLLWGQKSLKCFRANRYTSEDVLEVNEGEDVVVWEQTWDCLTSSGQTVSGNDGFLHYRI